MRRLSDPARQLLSQLHTTGGCPYVRLTRVAHGLAPSFLTAGERAGLYALVRSLERAGLILLHRDWGTNGYGRPTWIEVTEAGAAALQPPVAPAAAPAPGPGRSSLRPADRPALASAGA